MILWILQEEYIIASINNADATYDTDENNTCIYYFLMLSSHHDPLFLSPQGTLVPSGVRLIRPTDDPPSKF